MKSMKRGIPEMYIRDINHIVDFFYEISIIIIKPTNRTFTDSTSSKVHRIRSTSGTHHLRLEDVAMNAKRSLPLFFRIAGIALVLLSSVTTSAFALAADHAATGSAVLPPRATPFGYSLTDAAAATAYFNTGTRDPSTLPENFPFQILYTNGSNEFSVDAGTMFYIPVVYSDDTDSAYWPYPDVSDPAAVSDYYFSPDQLGAEFIKIVVDGKEFKLGPKYAVGAETPGLPTGANNYTVVAAFLAPLPKGVHTVTISARLTGEFIETAFGEGVIFEFEIPYVITVR